MTEPKISLTCWACGGVLSRSEGQMSCPSGHVMPVVAGIVDCRPPVTGFDVEADRRLAEDLAAQDGTFEALLRSYWSRQRNVATELTDTFVRGDVVGERRASVVVEQIEDLLGRSVAEDWTAIEVGCGTAALTTALARRAGHVVASDISLAWLVLAERRLESAGVRNVTLVAAVADSLPLTADAIDLVVAADVIEHVPDAIAMVRDCHRVLRPGGTLWLSTPNRLSLTPEPHVRVWGVGFLPRPLGRRLVHRVRGVAYDDINTLSVLGLRRILRPVAGRATVTTPEIAGVVRQGYGPLPRRLIDLYHLVRRVPLLRWPLLLVTPLFHATVVKERPVGAP